MSTIATSLGLIHLQVDDDAPASSRLKSAVSATVTAYLEKEAQQLFKRQQIERTLQMLRRQRKPYPARRAEDDAFLYDEGVFFPTRTALLSVLNPHQATRPVYEPQVKHWEIYDLESRLYITKRGTLARPIQSVIKANTMTEELRFDHPLVTEQHDDILRGLDAACVALAHV